MRRLRAMFLRLIASFSKSGPDREFADELASHLELHTDDNIRRGMSPSEARRAALISLGGVEAAKERYRDRRGFPLFEAILQDLRYAVRMLRKNPAFTATAILVLAIGIGANAAIFSVIEAVLLRPLPYKEPARLVRLTDPEDPRDAGFLYKDLEAWKSQSTFEDVAIYYRDGGWSRVTLTGDGDSEYAQGGFVSASFFPLLGISPALGRVFSADEAARRERLVVLGHGLWVRRFGASRDVVGKTLRISGFDWEIIGVMPVSFQLPFQDTQFWAPLETNSNWNDAALGTIDPNHNRYFYSRWQAMACFGSSPERDERRLCASERGPAPPEPWPRRKSGAASCRSRPKHAAGARGPVCGRILRAADCLREYREPDVGPGRVARARDGAASGPWRGDGPPGAPGFHRKRFTRTALRIDRPGSRAFRGRRSR